MLHVSHVVKCRDVPSAVDVCVWRENMQGREKIREKEEQKGEEMKNKGR